MARIAYLSSDVIVSVQPAQSIDSAFSVHLNRYAGRKDQSLVATADHGVPEVCASVSLSHLTRFFANSHTTDSNH